MRNSEFVNTMLTPVRKISPRGRRLVSSLNRNPLTSVTLNTMLRVWLVAVGLKFTLCTRRKRRVSVVSTVQKATTVAKVRV